MQMKWERWGIGYSKTQLRPGTFGELLVKYNVARANEIKEKAEEEARGRVYYNLGSTGFVM